MDTELKRELQDIRIELAELRDFTARRCTELASRLNRAEAESAKEPEFTPATREEAEKLASGEICFIHERVHVAESYLRLLDDHEKLVGAVKAWYDGTAADGYDKLMRLVHEVYRAAGIKE